MKYFGKIKELKTEFFEKFTISYPWELNPITHPTLFNEYPEDVWSWIEGKLAERENKWIDIKVELPKYYEPILVLTEDNKIYCAWLASDGETFLYTIYGDDHTVNREIKFWQPLPGLPKED
jgi:hypothetical protein